MRPSSIVVLSTCLFAITATSEVWSAPRLKIPLPFKHVEANPNKSYRLTEEQGPWLIICASFVGETGEKQANQLALELRSKYKLNSYTYQRNFDFGDTVEGLGLDKWGNRKRMKHAHATKFEETAVLVGDFDTFDDSRAQKTLEKLKYAKPETLKVSATTTTNQRLAVWREIQRRITPNEEMKRKGPMRSAFISRNPLLPEEYFAPKGPDTLIIDLNKGLEYSLLECRGNYSVRVATFRGDSTWDLKEIERAQKEVKLGIAAQDSRLADGAKKARILVGALRKRGVEAYQFHDRHESVVTVGSFDWVSKKRSDGRDEINPQIHQVMEIYKAQQKELPGSEIALNPRRLNGISFDAQPIPVQVPRESSESNLARIGR